MHKKYMHMKYMHREYMSIVLCTYTLPHLSKSLCLEARTAVTRRQGQGKRNRNKKKRTKKGKRKGEKNSYKHGDLGLTLQFLSSDPGWKRWGRRTLQGTTPERSLLRFSLVEHKPGEKQTIKAKK